MYDAPTPREPKSRPSGRVVLLVAVLIVATLAMALWLGSKFLRVPTEAEQRPERVITHSSLAPTYTYDGEVIRWYVLTDPDTGVQYLVNDRGGCCPRLDATGEPMGLAERGR